MIKSRKLDRSNLLNFILSCHEKGFKKSLPLKYSLDHKKNIVQRNKIQYLYTNKCELHKFNKTYNIYVIFTLLRCLKKSIFINPFL